MRPNNRNTVHGSGYPTVPRFFFPTLELFPRTSGQFYFLFCSREMMRVRVIKHRVYFMTSFSKCDHAGEM